jgi:hypothetical protein
MTRRAAAAAVRVLDGAPDDGARLAGAKVPVVIARAVAGLAAERAAAADRAAAAERERPNGSGGHGQARELDLVARIKVSNPE